MRRTTTRIAAVIAASLLLAGCAAADEEPTGPVGPNGYTLVAQIEAGTSIWWDRSDESGLTDVIATRDEDRIVGSCLGAAPQHCFVGPEEDRVLLVIAPETATGGTATYFGTEVPLTLAEGPSGDEARVLAAIMPARVEPEAGWGLVVTDAAGAPVMEQ